MPLVPYTATARFDFSHPICGTRETSAALRESVSTPCVFRENLVGWVWIALLKRAGSRFHLELFMVSAANGDQIPKLVRAASAERDAMVDLEDASAVASPCENALVPVAQAGCLPHPLPFRARANAGLGARRAASA
jgi:hypothetical protein